MCPAHYAAPNASPKAAYSGPDPRPEGPDSISMPPQPARWCINDGGIVEFYRVCGTTLHRERMRRRWILDERRETERIDLKDGYGGARPDAILRREQADVAPRGRRGRRWMRRLPPSSSRGGGGPSSTPHRRPLSVVLPSKIDDEDDDDDVNSTFEADDGTEEAAQNTIACRGGEERQQMYYGSSDARKTFACEHYLLDRQTL